jgi:signal transduction histidine kinase
VPLKSKLAIGAALLCLSTVLIAGLSVAAMERIAERLDAGLRAEQRVARYSVLSTQVSSFIVATAEAIQAGLPPQARAARLSTFADSIEQIFDRLRRDLETAVEEARALGLDETSRRATQSLGIARMEALFAATRHTLLSGETGPDRLRGTLDTFANAFDPLLNEVVTAEIRARETILDGIAGLRRRLVVASVVLGSLSVLAATGFYFGLVQPQFRRLDFVVDAARRIGREDFAIALPAPRRDEIGRLTTETGRMAEALSARAGEVARDRARLNEIVAERTEALRAARDRLTRVDEHRRRFFADISHELRTPLTVILVEAELGRKAGGTAATAFATIEARARRLNRRIDDLLRVARSESGRLALETAPFDLAEAARSALDETEAELAQAGMSASTDLPPALPALGDANWIRQVTGGLIRNALRHAREGGRVTISGAPCAGGAALRIVDAGPGIEDPAGVFERFAQGAGSAEGFGIGLSLAKWVIEEQGGTITVESPAAADAGREAPGTKVEIILPAPAQ